MPRKFLITLSKGGSLRTTTWMRNGGSNDDDNVDVYEEIKWATLTITIPDGDDIDIETLRANKNREWEKYEWELETTDIYGCEVSAVDEKYEEILQEEGEGGMEEALVEDGFTEGDSGWDWNSDVLSSIEEIPVS